MKEASNHGGEGAANYKKGLPGASHLLKQQGKPQTKGKCHCTRTLKCAVRHKLGKSSHFFPLFLEHLRQEEEAHTGAGSSLTFPLTLPQVLTNYTQGQTFLQPREQEAAGACTASAWHNRSHTGGRHGSEIVPISQVHAMTPCSSATLRVLLRGCGRTAWKEKQSEAFRTQPSAEEKLPGADQERKSPDMGTELGPGSKAGQAAWSGHFTLLQPHRNEAAPVWNNGKVETKRKTAFYTLSKPVQLRELPSSPSHKVVSGSERQQGSKPQQEARGTLQSLKLTCQCTPS